MATSVLQHPPHVVGKLRSKGCMPAGRLTAYCLQIRAPNEFQGAIIGDVNRRKGLIQNSGAEGDEVIVEAHVPLAEMFGYSTGLRSMTQGKGEFTMEYNQHAPVTADKLAELTSSHKRGS